VTYRPSLDGRLILRHLVDRAVAPGGGLDPEAWAAIRAGGCRRAIALKIGEELELRRFAWFIEAFV
jgi:hypothetical protein